MGGPSIFLRDTPKPPPLSLSLDMSTRKKEDAMATFTTTSNAMELILAWMRAFGMAKITLCGYMSCLSFCWQTYAAS